MVKNLNDASKGEMSIAAGGLIKQAILRDPHATDAWDSKNSTVFSKCFPAAAWTLHFKSTPQRFTPLLPRDVSTLPLTLM